ncbi:hypothetical protein BAE44_0013083 [Dichanthelium oligosanthes]|uniref:Fanconi anemia group I protein n=1 Tax=Dichanthelium oligosanthes TaxID=888268 RepID=A0A1E5VLB4_9POAL|nr:hypothetical protein BAE44_0013083 [Dichanthelium oligosanthes]
MSATTAPASQPSSQSQQPPPPPQLTADSVLRLASRDPSAAASHLPELPPEALDDILASLSAASPAGHLALLPAILSLSPSPSSVSAALAALLSAPTWPSATLLAVASLLRDLPPAYRNRVPAFLGKILSLLPCAEAQDLPAVVYQLLLLASKPLHPRAVLAGILRFFGGRRGARVRAPPSIARQVEGTVLLNVAFVVKQDPALAREVLAAVKADAAGALSGFAVAVLLSVARVRRFNEGAVSVLRDAAVVSRRDYRMSRWCKWLPHCMKEKWARATQCVEKGLLKAVDESIVGREHVVPSIVQVGFRLLEVLDGDRVEEAGLDEGVMSTEEIGISMLKSLFEIHEMARTEIIEKCKFRILSAKPQQSAPVLRLLVCLIRGHPFPMLEYIAHLKELLDYFSFMNDKTSTGLISCILPLTKFSRDLKDYIILVVRKAMFKREDMVRIAATNAIVELIIAESRKSEANPFEDSSSQPSSSQQPGTQLEFGRGLFQELSGLLRRCLSQQTSVKEVLYEGLVRIVTSDPAIADNVLDFLWPHFLNYYTEDAECPLKIGLCFKIENAKLCIVEPLDCLLSCISRIIRIQQISKCERPHDAYWKCFGFAASQDNEAGRTSSSDLFVKALSSIQKYLRISLTEDQRGQSQETGSLSSPSEMAHCHNLAMLGIIEVFVDFAASKLEKASEESKEMIEKEILELADAHCGFERKTSNSREKIARRRGNAGDATDKHTNEPKENSNASLQKLHEKRGKFVNSSLHELTVMCVKQCNDDSYKNCSQRPSQTKSNQSSYLVSFVLKAFLELLKSLATKDSGNFRIKLYEDLKMLIQPIMQLIWRILLDSNQENGGTKRKMTQGKKNIEYKKDQLYLALACLKELLKSSVSGDHSNDIIEVIISSAPPNIEVMMDASELDKNDTTMVEDRSTKNVHVLLNILKMLYARVLSQSLLRESEAVTELILGISRKLHLEQRHLVGNWATDLCRKKTIQSPSIAREVVKLAISLTKAPDDMNHVSEMAAELKKLITSGEDNTRDSSDMFHIINCKTKSSLAAVCLQMVELSLAELDWGLSKLKAMLTLGYDSANIDEDQPADETMQRLALEESLYSRSILIVHVLSSFADMSLKDTQAEHFLKLTAKFYKLLTRMSKSQIAPKGYTQSIPSLKFQKLAEETCRTLTSPLYDFVSSVQQNEQTPRKGNLAKIRRESKCIPDLIYQIEDYEKYLIQLSKLTKVNLLRHAKRSVARDFQIKDKSGERQQEEDPAPANASPSDNEADEDAGGPNAPVESNADENTSSESEHDEYTGGLNAPVEANADENVRPSIPCGSPIQESESDSEEEEILARRKRAKTKQVVQDSDEEAEDE